MKLDSKLALAWSARFVAPASGMLQPSAAAATADGGLLIGGVLEQSAYVMRLAADGRVKWARRLDASGRDVVHDVIETRDGGIVCAGLSRNSPWMARLSANGDLEWQHLYSRAPGGFDAVAELTGGDLVAAGSTVLIVRTTAKGDPVWQKGIPAGKIAIARWSS